MKIEYPIKIKVSKAFIDDLMSVEYGRYEDAETAREANDQDAIKTNDYGCVFCDFGGRHKTMIECRNNQELAELYYVCASGTIGLREGCNRGVTANRVLDEIRDMVASFDEALVRQWPRQDCC